MKYFNKETFFILSLSVMMFSCFDELGTIFEGPFHAKFTTSSGSAGENATTPSEISVHFVGPQQSSDITVNYSLSGTAIEGTDYTVNGTSGVVVIPANQSFGTISLSMIDNLVQDGNKIVEFEITGVSGGFAAGHGKVGLAFELTINDDDCSPNLEGTWTVTSEVCAGDGGGNCGSGTLNYTQDVTITRLSAGVYTFSDITGGLYLQGYNSSDQPATVNDACGILSLTAQPDTVFGGDEFNGSGVIIDVDNFTLSYANGWGDQGLVTYARQ